MWGCVAAIVLTAVKRLEANRAPLPSGPERRQVIWRRLWLDRDIPSHEAWVARGPAEIQPDTEQEPDTTPSDAKS